MLCSGVSVVWDTSWLYDTDPCIWGLVNMLTLVSDRADMARALAGSTGRQTQVARTVRPGEKKASSRECKSKPTD